MGIPSRQSSPLDPGLPGRAYYAHPLFHPEHLYLTTRAGQRLVETLRQWLWTGTAGGLIYGSSRVGKTTALRHLMRAFLFRDGKPVPACYVSIPRRDQATIRTVFRQLCWSVGLAVRRSDRTDHLSDRFVHYLADQATAQGCASTVLIVDEMQRLSPRQLEAFAEVYDHLLVLGISLCTLFVGNDPECWTLVERLDDTAHAHVRGRFFLQGTELHGLKNREDVAHCLQQYDRKRYPQHGPTYAAFFLPEAVRDGWTFASLSPLVWQAFREYQKTYALPSWPMKYFVATVNTLLVDFLPRYGIEAVDAAMVEECIRVSGLVPSLVKPVP